MNDKIQKAPMVPPFVRFVCSAVPMVFDDSLSYYEALCALWKWLQDDVVNVINNNATVTEDYIQLTNEYIEKFNELKTYVDTYFDNLDVQDEINNKLDEMAEDGTLQEIMAQYVTSKVDWGFNTVADMKASENLVSGSYAHTYGYYAVDDGGESFYYITSILPTTYYETLDSGLYAQLIKQPIMNVEQYGAYGDGSNDDTTAISNCIGDAYDGENINFTKEYKISDGFSISKNIKLIGDGVLLPYDGTSSYVVFTVSSDDFSADNIKIDGTHSTQDQFSETTYSNIKLITGFRVSAENVDLRNIDIENLYGNGIQLLGYKNVYLENIRINDVGGHWYQNNANDSFGDGVYFGGTAGESNITINNIILTGKYKNTTLSRCGICFENLGADVDTITHVKINSGSITKYDRIFHVEGNDGVIEVNGELLTLNGNCMYCYGSDPTKFVLSLDKCNIGYTGNDYNGTRGMRNIKFAISNSSINATTEQALANYYSTGIFDKCNITGIAITQFNSAGEVLLKDCVITLGTLSTYLVYGSKVTLNGCKVSASSNITGSRSGSAIDVYSCEFVNYLPYANYMDIKTVVKMTSGFSITTIQKYYHQATTFYVNDVNIFKPNMAGAIPIYNVEKLKLQLNRDIPSGNTIAFIPTFNTALRSNAKYALISVGTNDNVHIANARNFDGVYLNIVTTDSNGVIMNVGTTSTIGTVASGRALTIDTGNNTVAQSGTYANKVIQYLLDVSDLDCIFNYTS